MKVFCFPYAGGSALVYSKWKRDFLDIVPVELPGRGRRFSEKLCDNMEKLVDQLFNELKESFMQEEYMIFGHSMGSLITFYLTERIVKEGIRQPSCLFLSGHASPDVTKPEGVSYKMDDETFKNGIFKLGGTPEEVVNNEQLCEIFIPILKNDYKLIETRKKVTEVKPFECDIVVLNGTKDDITYEEKVGWKKYTTGEFEMHNFEGGHFYLKDYEDEIVNIIDKKIKDIKMKSVLTGVR